LNIEMLHVELKLLKVLSFLASVTSGNTYILQSM